jgi:hypothetical protein
MLVKIRSALSKLLRLRLKDDSTLPDCVRDSTDPTDAQPSLLRLRSKLRSEFADSRRVRIAEQRRNMLLGFLSELSDPNLIALRTAVATGRPP